MAEMQDATANVPPDTAPPAAQVRDEQAVLPLGGKKILIVEDEAIISFLLEDMIASLGCEDIALAGSVKSALVQIEDFRPDAVVLDVNLGGEMAYPVAEKLRALGTPFVFTTGYGRGGVKAEWTSQAVVQKPFNIDALAVAVRAILVAPAA